MTPTREAVALSADQSDATWKCKANPRAIEPEDCGWPECGCDPHAERVMQGLIESGWTAPADREAIRGSATTMMQAFYEARGGHIADGLSAKAETAHAKLTATLAMLDAEPPAHHRIKPPYVMATYCPFCGTKIR